MTKNELAHLGTFAASSYQGTWVQGPVCSAEEDIPWVPPPPCNSLYWGSYGYSSLNYGPFYKDAVLHWGPTKGPYFRALPVLRAYVIVHCRYYPTVLRSQASMNFRGQSFGFLPAPTAFRLSGGGALNPKSTPQGLGSGAGGPHKGVAGLPCSAFFLFRFSLRDRRELGFYEDS